MYNIYAYMSLTRVSSAIASTQPLHLQLFCTVLIPLWHPSSFGSSDILTIHPTSYSIWLFKTAENWTWFICIC